MKLEFFKMAFWTIIFWAVKRVAFLVVTDVSGGTFCSYI
jgi:hypothetical protein